MCVSTIWRQLVVEQHTGIRGKEQLKQNWRYRRPDSLVYTNKVPFPFCGMNLYTCLSYVTNIGCQGSVLPVPMSSEWPSLALFMCINKGWQREQLPQEGSTWRWHPVVMETNAMFGLGWECVGWGGWSTVTGVSNDVCSTMLSAHQRSSLLRY